MRHEFILLHLKEKDCTLMHIILKQIPDISFTPFKVEMTAEQSSGFQMKISSVCTVGTMSSILSTAFYEVQCQNFQIVLA